MNKTVNSMKSFHPKKAVTFATIKKVGILFRTHPINSFFNN